MIITDLPATIEGARRRPDSEAPASRIFINGDVLSFLISASNNLFSIFCPHLKNESWDLKLFFSLEIQFEAPPQGINIIITWTLQSPVSCNKGRAAQRPILHVGNCRRYPRKFRWAEDFPSDLQSDDPGWWHHSHDPEWWHHSHRINLKWIIIIIYSQKKFWKVIRFFDCDQCGGEWHNFDNVSLLYYFDDICDMILAM